jgi:hypothetical protein
VTCSVTISIALRFDVAIFGQSEAQVTKAGTLAELTCVSKPFTAFRWWTRTSRNILLVVNLLAGEELIDLQQMTRTGTLTAFLEPL